MVELKRDIAAAFAEHGKWVQIGCKTWQNCGTQEEIAYSNFNYLQSP
jgi:hypothetical protein